MRFDDPATERDYRDAVARAMRTPYRFASAIGAVVAVAAWFTDRSVQVTEGFLYDLWGDTVNLASRLESHGLPGEIQVSGETRARLGERFAVEARGKVAIKGKGDVETWLLRGS